MIHLPLLVMVATGLLSKHECWYIALALALLLLNRSMPKVVATYLSVRDFIFAPVCFQTVAYLPSEDTAIGSGGMIIIPRLEDKESLSGATVVSVEAVTAYFGYDGTLNFQMMNWTKGTKILSTEASIDANEKTSLTADTPYVIDQANDDVSGGDILVPVITSLHDTQLAKGLTVKTCVSP